MTINPVALVIGFAMLAFLAFAFWYSKQFPREIIGAGTIQVSGVRGNAPVTLRTRDVSINKVVFKEIEMPNGTWIDCAGDCAKAAREAGDGFWSSQINNKR